jgi:CheY-like chemotaxis protein
MGDIRPVVVVEDDQLLLAHVAQILEEAGYDVIATETGEEALSFLLRAPMRCTVLLAEGTPWPLRTDHRIVTVGQPYRRDTILGAVSASPGSRG